MKPLVLMAAPGAGGAGDAGLQAIENDIRRSFDLAGLGWIYTSSRLLERARRAGRPVFSPQEGVAKLKDHAGKAVILSLHLVNGREYGHLADALESVPGQNPVLTRPLLESPEAAQGLVRSLLDTNPIDIDEVRILVTHGSPEPDGAQALAAFGALAQQADARTMLASLLGEPDFNAAVKFCESHGCKNVCLVPLLLTGGPSAQSLANPEDPVLAPFRAAGIATRGLSWGLLSMSEVRQLWVTRLEQVLQKD